MTPAEQFGRRNFEAITARETAEKDLASFTERAGPASTRLMSNPTMRALGYTEEYYEDPELESEFRGIKNREHRARQQEANIRREHRESATGASEHSADQEGQRFSGMVRTLKSRFNYTDDQLSNIVRRSGVDTYTAISQLFRRHMDEELVGSTHNAAMAAMPTTLEEATAASPTAMPVSPEVAAPPPAATPAPSTPIATPAPATPVATSAATPRAGSYIHTEAEINHLKSIVSRALGPNKREYVDEVVEQLLTLPFPFFRGRPLPRSNFGIESIVRDYINSRPELRDPAMGQTIQRLDAGGREAYRMVEEQQQSAPASRPGIRIGREIGESSRVSAPPPTATTPAPVANETEDQIYNRLLQEQPENFRNDVEVQNDARAEARLTARAGQTQQTATPEASGAINPMTDPSGFNARILNVRAQEILFKADKFEYSEGFQLATGSPTPTPGPTPGPAAGGEGASSVGGSTPTPTAAAAGGSTSGATSAVPAAGAPGVTQIGSANITGLDFAAGVDQRIKPGIADKTKEIQSAFGKKLTVTSGFRDPARNSRVGGAGGSKHLTGDAVDVQFPGNQQETIDFIKVASEKGAGGIGVYRPGFLHIDTGAKRVWGPDYKATSIPDWAKPALDEHMGKPASQSAGGGAAAGGGETASPMPGGQQQAAGAPAATPEPSAPSSGAAMSSASVADETASRPSAGPTPPPPDSTAPITAAPQGPSLPGIDPNNPGSVEPADAAIRYSRLFNIAA